MGCPRSPWWGPEMDWRLSYTPLSSHSSVPPPHHPCSLAKSCDCPVMQYPASVPIRPHHRLSEEPPAGSWACRHREAGPPECYERWADPEPYPSLAMSLDRLGTGFSTLNPFSPGHELSGEPPVRLGACLHEKLHPSCSAGGHTGV